MTDSTSVSKKKARVLELDIRAQIEQWERYQPWWAPAVQWVEQFVRMLPTYRDTRSSRRSTQQMRVVFVIVAVLWIVLSEHLFFWIIGMIALAAALALPMKEIKKSSLLSKLKRMRQARRRTVIKPGAIRFDGRRLELHQDAKMLRKVLTGKHSWTFVVKRYRDAKCMQVTPSSGRKRDTLWICVEDAPESEEPETLQELTPQEVDILAHVSLQDWEELKTVLLDAP